MAVLIDEFCHKKIAGVVRVAMYMPHICNIVAISVVWMALYSKYGPFTQLMRALGWQDPPRFLASYEWALPAIMLVVIWASLGTAYLCTAPQSPDFREICMRLLRLTERILFRNFSNYGSAVEAYRPFFHDNYRYYIQL